MIYIGLIMFGISIALMFFFSFFWMIKSFVYSVKLTTNNFIILGITYIIAGVLFVFISLVTIGFIVFII